MKRAKLEGMKNNTERLFSLTYTVFETKFVTLS